VNEAVEALGVEVDVLKKHIKANTIPTSAMNTGGFGCW
jgi:hypothetical protein